jgi:phosphatidylglycerol:prolipoprotein diacylglycerol transferase
MRSVLFFIPLNGRVDLGPLGKVAVFGPGILLAVWCLVGIIFVVQTFRREGWKGLAGTSFLGWGLIATAIWYAPRITESVPVYGYATMLICGLWASYSLAARRLRQERADGEIAFDAAMWIFFSGIVGGRLFYVVQYHAQFFGPDPVTGRNRDLGEILWGLVNLSRGGLVLYGGLFVTPVAYWLFCRQRKIRALALADIAITSVFVGIMFGRLGCLLHGCCYGDVCSLPWAVTFPAKSVPFESLVARGLLDESAARSLPLHPSQIYDSLSALLLAIVTYAYYPYRRRSGEVLAVGLIAYPINRFLIEFLRSDEAGQFGTPLTIAQWVSLGLFASGVGFCFYLRSRSPGREPVEIAPPAQAKAA